MKITDLEVKKETVEGVEVLRCRITLEDGHQKESVVYWRNEMGLWASASSERDPAEIAAYLRAFARAIEEACKAAA